MISPERLRLHPFFGDLTPDQLNALAMLADTVAYPKDTVIFQVGAPAKTIYLLEKGCVELYYESFDPVFKPELRRQYLIGEVNPGEVFGVSALIEPYKFTSVAATATPCQMVEIDAEKLRALSDNFPELMCVLSKQIIHTLMERLHYTRIQLAAERAP
ncbi:MAG: Crp/Fnr family transcriptional regulator [Anaerolineales bacterium]|nr:Crp/Fnr family transcriptional regulator [Anaerolineales bacterium]